jgi:histidinol-phosphatase (PHP family)
LIDLHNHTPLCNHCSGNVDEFIKEAIKKGITVYGFSDHNPMEFDKKYRMNFDDMKIYKNWVYEAKEKYKNKIEILYGYEVDFMPKYLDEKLLNEDVDYLIGSVHFLDNWGFDNPEFIKEWESRNVDDVYEEYFSLIKQMADSKLFQIVGHLDLIKIFGYKPTKNLRDIITPALHSIKESDMIIEINSAGLRKPVKEQYPSVDILKVIKEMDIDITFSSDAHSVEQVGLNLEKVYELAKNIGFDKATFYRKKEKIYKGI